MTVENRGTSNTNDRGSAESRRRRKQWLFEIWAADVDVVTPDEQADLADALFLELRGSEARTAMYLLRFDFGSDFWALQKGLGRPAVRCFRCGTLLDWETVEIDRIKPGCEGGRYTKNNIRPVCGPDNKILAGEHTRRKNAKRKAANARRRELAAEQRAHLELERAKCAALTADVDWSISENADVV